MAEEPVSDLGALTLASCQAHLGGGFTRPNDAGPDVPLDLVSAEPGRRDPRAGDSGDRPFCLVFRGPTDLQLTQGMHDLEHPHLPLRGVFLVPVGGDDEGMLYEAVFS